MPPQKSKGELSFEQAEKKANGTSGGWFGFGSSETKYEDAGNLFENAGNAFKLEKDYSRAGDAFMRAAECREKYKSDGDAAKAWWDAAKAFKLGADYDRAINCYRQTIKYNAGDGRFRQAADREKDVGEIYKEKGDLKNACLSFQQAADWYFQEDAKATAARLYGDAADLHAEIEEFGEAISLYEKVAEEYSKSQLTKFSVKEVLLKQGLCALANGDAVSAKRMLEASSRDDPTFATTREARFLTGIVEAVDAGDVEAFTSLVADYDRISVLDKWKTNLLLKIKKDVDEDVVLT